LVESGCKRIEFFMREVERKVRAELGSPDASSVLRPRPVRHAGPAARRLFITAKEETNHMALLEVEPGQNIYYEHYRGDGTPVVLVHGWGMGVRIWDLTLPALLDAGHEVVAFDQRCCGKSDKDFTDVRTDTIAGDVGKLIKAIGLQSPAVLGWSFGSAVTAAAAGALGSALSGIVLVGPTTPRFTQTDGFPHGGTAEAVEQNLTALRETRADFLHLLTLDICHTPISPEMVAWQWQMFMETSPRADASLGDLGIIDHRELLTTITIPAVLCVGAHDTIVDPEIGRAAAALLPNNRLVEFANSGHAPFLEEREKFNTEVVGFLAGL
jgi:non-heme chloroperoxidase